MLCGYGYDDLIILKKIQIRRYGYLILIRYVFDTGTICEKSW